MSDATVITPERRGEAGLGDCFALLKPRVMSLAVFTALAGVLVAPVQIHPVIAFASVLFIALGAGAAGALNMWWDADIDALMSRTASRPVPTGRIAREDALAIGVALAGVSVVMLALAANLLAAGLLAFTIFFYTIVYTMWLKRLTPQNIVIGGAAGAFPPVIGWVVATGSVGLEALLMFALILIWTPPHFWALALFTKSDYANAQVPMLTVTHGHRVTRFHILAYTLLLAPFSLGLGLTSIGGPIYLAVATVMNIRFIRSSIDIWRRDRADSEADGYRAEKSAFRLSIHYLFLHFAALLVEATLRQFGLEFW